MLKNCEPGAKQDVEFRWIHHDALEVTLRKESTLTSHAVSCLHSIVCFSGKIDKFISNTGAVWEKYQPLSQDFHCVLQLPNLPIQMVGIALGTNHFCRTRASALALAVMQGLDSEQNWEALNVDFARLCDTAKPKH